MGIQSIEYLKYPKSVWLVQPPKNLAQFKFFHGTDDLMVFFVNEAMIRFRFVWFWLNEKSYDMQMRIYKIHGIFAFFFFGIFSKWGDRDQSELEDLSPAVNGIESEPSKNKWQKTPFILATFLHFFTSFFYFSLNLNKKAVKEILKILAKSNVTTREFRHIAHWKWNPFHDAQLVFMRTTTSILASISGS